MYHKIKCCCGTCKCQNEIEVPDYVNSAICFDCGQADHKMILSVAENTKPVIELSEDFEGFHPGKDTKPKVGLILDIDKEKPPFFVQ